MCGGVQDANEGGRRDGHQTNLVESLCRFAMHQSHGETNEAASFAPNTCQPPCLPGLVLDVSASERMMGVARLVPCGCILRDRCLVRHVQHSAAAGCVHRFCQCCHEALQLACGWPCSPCQASPFFKESTNGQPDSCMSLNIRQSLFGQARRVDAAHYMTPPQLKENNMMSKVLLSAKSVCLRPCL